MFRRTVKLIFGSAIATIFVAGTFAVFAPAHAVIGHCICPDVYDPVKCSNGRTYSNGCVASCNHATGCVRIGNI